MLHYADITTARQFLENEEHKKYFVSFQKYLLFFSISILYEAGRGAAARGVTA